MKPVAFLRLPHSAGLPAPEYASADASGMDLCAAVPGDAPVTLAPGDHASIPTGLCLAIPSGYEGQVRPRSGLALDHGVTVLNAPGTVDADYRGEVRVLLVNLGGLPFAVTRGLRIAQLVIAPVARATLREAAELPESERGERGFGSTGLTPSRAAR